jgi:hypothetical protein
MGVVDAFERREVLGPVAFVATTETFKYLVTSSFVGEYVWLVAPEMSEYVPPEVVARDH